MRRRQIARPIPSPADFVVWNGSKTLPHLLHRDTAAVVADAHGHGPFSTPCLDIDLTPFARRVLHRLGGVKQEIHEDLLQLYRRHLHTRQSRRKRLPEFDLLAEHFAV